MEPIVPSLWRAEEGRGSQGTHSGREKRPNAVDAFVLKCERGRHSETVVVMMMMMMMMMIMLKMELLLLYTTTTFTTSTTSTKLILVISFAVPLRTCVCP